MKGKRMYKTSDSASGVFHEYQELSIAVSSDYSFVQGGGGNVSIKTDKDLIVKASGTRLNEATASMGFVVLNREAAKECIKSGASLQQAVAADSPDGRPSIEAPLHVECGGKYVVHIHSVGAIAIGLIEEGFAFCAEEGWQYVEYVLPGEPLLSALKSSDNFSSPAGVSILANHGLLVWDTSIENCIKRVVQAEDKCRNYFVGKNPFQNIDEIKNGIDLENNESLDFGSVISDQWLRFILENTLFPDQAVFLSEVKFESLIQDNLFFNIKPLSMDQKEMLKLLHLLGKILRPEDCKRPLSTSEVSTVLGLDSEKYRIEKIK
jgi:ribulose-5-phosphate 4-epimerase/fuculose-1-phosphate aldolase